MSVRQLLAPGSSGSSLMSSIVPACAPATSASSSPRACSWTTSRTSSKTLDDLKALGVTLSIDDFGTGYSSLSYLKRYPVDAVKVDRSFVDGLGSQAHDSALVAAIVAMADALGLAVTAEGVETPEQLAIVRGLGCGRAQGFHLARPVSGEELARLVADHHLWDVS